MKKVVAGLVTVAMAVVAIPTVAASGVDFDKVLKTSALNVVLPKETKQQEVKTFNKETNVVTDVKQEEVKSSDNETNVATEVNVEAIQETTQAVVSTTVVKAEVPVTTQVTSTTDNSKQEVATTTQVRTTAEVTTTVAAPVTTAQEVKQEEVTLGANDLFGLVGHPGADYSTPEFQEKWDAMMAERTVSDEEYRLAKLSEHNE